MYKNIYKYVYKYAWIRKQIHIFYMYLCIFFQNQIDTIYMSILYSRRYIFYTRNLTFSYVFFFFFFRGWTMWTALPLRRRCASAIVSRYWQFTDGIAMGVGGAMRWELMIYTP